MTQEHKELLIKDICSRLPYGLVIDYNGIRTKLHDVKVFQLYDGDNIKDYICLIDIFGDDDYVDVKNIKPYLLPLSSMTEEQTEELLKLINSGQNDNNEFMRSLCRIEFYHKHHFDYIGLIPIGLANDATNLNIY